MLMSIHCLHSASIVGGLQRPVPQSPKDALSCLHRHCTHVHTLMNMGLVGSMAVALMPFCPIFIASRRNCYFIAWCQRLQFMVHASLDSDSLVRLPTRVRSLASGISSGTTAWLASLATLGTVFPGFGNPLEAECSQKCSECASLVSQVLLDLIKLWSNLVNLFRQQI